MPLKYQSAGVGLVEAGQQVEERGLAGTVGSDERGDPTPLKLDVVHVHGGDTAETPDHAVGSEDGIGFRRPGLGQDLVHGSGH